MGSNKLVLSALMALTLFGLGACKKSGNSARTQIRKSGAAGNAAKPGVPGATANAGKPGTVTAGGVAAGGTSGAGTAADASVRTREEQAKQIDCATIKQDTTSAWVAKEVTNTVDNVKIVYFVLKAAESRMKNPVIYFKRNAFQSIDKDDLTKFSDYAEEFGIDPILMDMRGVGCSSKVTDNSKIGSKFTVADAEVVRKKQINTASWKILAERAGGAVALRYVQLVPTAVTSIHISDFATMADQKKLMKLRVEQEEKNLKALIEKGFLTADDIKKAQEVLTADNKCGGLTNCKDALDLFASRLSNTKEWQVVANEIKDIASKKTSSDEIDNQVKARRSNQARSLQTRILDLTSDKTVAACQEAIKDTANNAINSCRLEVSLSQGLLDSVKATVHDPLNMAKIKANLTAGNIPYHLISGKLSTAVPADIVKDHIREMGDRLENSIATKEDEGSEVSLNKEFLSSLRE